MQISSQTLVTVTLTEQEVVQILAERTAISGWRIEVWDVDAPDAAGGSDMEWEARLPLHEYTDPDAVPDDLVAQLLVTEVYEEDGTVTAVVDGATLVELIAERALPTVGLTPGQVAEHARKEVWIHATDAEPRILTFTWTKSNDPDGSLRMRPTQAAGADQTERGALR